MERERALSPRLGGAGVGLLGAALWLAGTTAVAPLVGGVPVAGLAQLVVDASPGALATAAIETLGTAAQPAVIAAICLGILAVGGAAGAGWSALPGTDRTRATAGSLALLAVTAAAVGSRDPGTLRGVVGTGLAAAPVLVFGEAVRRGVEAGAVPGRRTALESLGAALLGVVGATAVARGVAVRDDDGEGGPGEPLEAVAEKRDGGETTAAGAAARTAATPDVTDRRRVGTVTVTASEATGEFGFDFAGMPRTVTPVESHYVIHKAVETPTVDRTEWTLTVEGAVEEPYDLDFEGLLDSGGTERVVTMACISNEVGGDLISTGRWRGVPVRDLIERAGPTDEVVDVVTTAADGYDEAIPWSYVRDHPEVMLVYGLNGRTLTTDHGYPARLLVPGRYGMRSTKWVTGLELSDGDHEAYWEQRGWNEQAVVNTLSSVRAVQRRGDRMAVGGFAYAGLRGVDRVELSLDGGETWQEAALEEPVGDLTGRRFRLVTDARDSFEAVVRATDGTGETQTRIPSPPHPDGSTGWHRVDVEF